MLSRRILREPLVHFVLIGMVLFAAAELRRREPNRLEDKTIVVDAHVRQQLADAFRSANGRPPTAAELDQRVSQHVDEEILYREGVARGLHRDDARVRQRVAEKMAFVLRSRIVVPPPTNDELRRFFEAHRRNYDKPELFDFVQVFVSGLDQAASLRAADLLEKLRAGTDPNGLGDRFSGGRHYRGRKLEDLAQSFGDDFVRGLRDQPLGEWAARRSRFGIHLVKIEKRTPSKSPELAEVKLDVEKDWEAAQRAARFEAELSELRADWKIER